MLDELIHWDWQTTLFLNDWGGSYIDQFFLFITEKYNSLPLYIFLLITLWRTERWRALLVALVIIALMIAASDQIASLFKYGVQRWRPYNEPVFQDQISAIGKQKGRYGFYSAHASTAVALATFIFFVFKNRLNYIVWITSIWAIIMAYSRIYLGLHYLGDVLAGTIAGLVLGYGAFRLYAFAKAKFLKNTVI